MGVLARNISVLGYLGRGGFCYGLANPNPALLGSSFAIKVPAKGAAAVEYRVMLLEDEEVGHRPHMQRSLRSLVCMSGG